MQRKRHLSVEYEHYLDILWAIISKYSSKYILMQTLSIQRIHVRDKALAGFCGDHGLVTTNDYYSGSSFAHKGGQGESKIDHFLSLAWQEDVIDYVYKATYSSNTSDHQPIVAVADNIFSASREIQPAIPVIQRYDWDKIDLSIYNRCLQVELSEIQGLPPNTTSKIDSLLIPVTNAIKKAAHGSVPAKRIKQKRHKHRIWSPKISKCVKEKKAAFWELKNAKTEADKVILKAKCKETKSRLRSSQRKEHAMQRIDEYNIIMKASSKDEVL